MLLLLTLLGCHGNCGDYTVSTGVWADHIMGDLWDGDPTLNPKYDPAYHDAWPLDGDYYEMCGKQWGTFGSWDPLGDGWSSIFFRLDDRDFDRDINGLFLDLEVVFPAASAQAGTTVSTGTGDLRGDAMVVDAGGAAFKLSPLVTGELRFTSGELSSDVCTEAEGWGGAEGPTFGLAWDLVFENPGEETRFTAKGADQVWFDTLSAAECWQF